MRRIAGSRRAGRAIGLAIGVLLGASLSLGSLGPPRSPSEPPPLTAEATGLQALHAVETALGRQGPQRWTDFSDLGISSAVPFSPWLLGGNVTPADYFAGQLSTLWACHALPMPSLWNASAIPAQPGNLSSGRAPFWQFLFANESRPGVLSFAVGVVADARVYVSADLPSTDPCIRALGFGNWTTLPVRSQPGFDTSRVGPTAFQDLASAYSPLVEGSAVLWLDGTPLLSNLGWSSFASQDGAVWDADYYACGEAGETHLPESLTSAYLGLAVANGSVVTGVALGADASCTLSNYTVSAAPAGNGPLGDAFADNLSLSVSGFLLGATYNSTQGLSTWMIEPQMETGDRLPVVPGDLGCLNWTENLSSCGPPSGWTAVLLSPSGGWLDAYGLIGGSPGWAEANVPFVTGETLALLSPTPLAGSGEVFSVNPTVIWPTVGASGSVQTL